MDYPGFVELATRFDKVNSWLTLLTLEGREIRLDKDGYLAALDDWSEPVAEALAAREELAPDRRAREILQCSASSMRSSSCLRPTAR